jgi:hypothetical protein
MPVKKTIPATRIPAMTMMEMYVRDVVIHQQYRLADFKLLTKK